MEGAQFKLLIQSDALSSTREPRNCSHLSHLSLLFQQSQPDPFLLQQSHTVTTRSFPSANPSLINPPRSSAPAVDEPPKRRKRGQTEEELKRWRGDGGDSRRRDRCSRTRRHGRGRRKDRSSTGCGSPARRRQSRHPQGTHPPRTREGPWRWQAAPQGKPPLRAWGRRRGDAGIGQIGREWELDLRSAKKIRTTIPISGQTKKPSPMALFPPEKKTVVEKAPAKKGPKATVPATRRNPVRSTRSRRFFKYPAEVISPTFVSSEMGLGRKEREGSGTASVEGGAYAGRSTKRGSSA